MVNSPSLSWTAGPLDYFKTPQKKRFSDKKKNLFVFHYIQFQQLDYEIFRLYSINLKSMMRFGQGFRDGRWFYPFKRALDCHWTIRSDWQVQGQQWLDNTKTIDIKYYIDVYNQRPNMDQEASQGQSAAHHFLFLSFGHSIRIQDVES